MPSFLSRFSTKSKDRPAASTSSSARLQPDSTRFDATADADARSNLLPLNLPSSSLLVDTSRANPHFLSTPDRQLSWDLSRPSSLGLSTSPLTPTTPTAAVGESDLRSLRSTDWVAVDADQTPRTIRTSPFAVNDASVRPRGTRQHSFPAGTDAERQEKEQKRLEKARLSVEDVTLLLDECGEVIRSRGLTTLGLFRPFRASESASQSRKLALLFLDYVAEFDERAAAADRSSPSRGSDASKTVLLHAYRHELRFANVHDCVAVLKWGLRHLDFGRSSFSAARTPSLARYSVFLERSATANPPHPYDAFSTMLLPSLPPPSQHLLLAVLRLMQPIVAHTQQNAMPAPKLAYLLGAYIFGLAGPPPTSPSTSAAAPANRVDTDEFASRWQESGFALEGCLKAYLREQADLPPRLQDLIEDYPAWLSATTRGGARVRSRTIRALKVEIETLGEWQEAGAVRSNSQSTGLKSGRTEGGSGWTPRAARRKPVEVLAAALEAAESGGELGGVEARAWESLAQLMRRAGRDGEAPGLAALDEETVRVLRLLHLDGVTSSTGAGVPSTPARARGSSPHRRTRSSVDPADLSPGRARNSFLSPSPSLPTISPRNRLRSSPSWQAFSTQGFTQPPFEDLTSDLYDPAQHQALPLELAGARRQERPTARIVSESIVDIDEDFVSIWLDSLVETVSLASPVAGWPSLLLSPLAPIAQADSALASEGITALFVVESLLPRQAPIAPLPAVHHAPPPLAVPQPAPERAMNRRSSFLAVRRGRKSEGAVSSTSPPVSPSKNWRRRASALFAPPVSSRAPPETVEGSSPPGASSGNNRSGPGPRLGAVKPPPHPRPSGPPADVFGTAIPLPAPPPVEAMQLEMGMSTPELEGYRLEDSPRPESEFLHISMPRADSSEQVEVANGASADYVVKEPSAGVEEQSGDLSAGSSTDRSTGPTSDVNGGLLSSTEPGKQILPEAADRSLTDVEQVASAEAPFGWLGSAAGSEPIAEREDEDADEHGDRSVRDKQPITSGTSGLDDDHPEAVAQVAEPNPESDSHLLASEAALAAETPYHEESGQPAAKHDDAEGTGLQEPVATEISPVDSQDDRQATQVEGTDSSGVEVIGLKLAAPTAAAQDPAAAEASTEPHFSDPSAASIAIADVQVPPHSLAASEQEGAVTSSAFPIERDDALVQSEAELDGQNATALPATPGRSPPRILTDAGPPSASRDPVGQSPPALPSNALFSPTNASYPASPPPRSPRNPARGPSSPIQPRTGGRFLRAGVRSRSQSSLETEEMKRLRRVEEEEKRRALPEAKPPKLVSNVKERVRELEEEATSSSGSRPGTSPNRTSPSGPTRTSPRPITPRKSAQRLRDSSPPTSGSPLPALAPAIFTGSPVPLAKAVANSDAEGPGDMPKEPVAIAVPQPIMEVDHGSGGATELKEAPALERESYSAPETTLIGLSSGAELSPAEVAVPIAERPELETEALAGPEGVEPDVSLQAEQDAPDQLLLTPPPSAPCAALQDHPDLGADGRSDPRQDQQDITSSQEPSSTTLDRLRTATVAEPALAVLDASGDAELADPSPSPERTTSLAPPVTHLGDTVESPSGPDHDGTVEETTSPTNADNMRPAPSDLDGLPEAAVVIQDAASSIPISVDEAVTEALPEAPTLSQEDPVVIEEPIDSAGIEAPAAEPLSAVKRPSSPEPSSSSRQSAPESLPTDAGSPRSESPNANHEAGSATAVALAAPSTTVNAPAHAIELEHAAVGPSDSASTDGPVAVAPPDELPDAAQDAAPSSSLASTSLEAADAPLPPPVAMPRVDDEPAVDDEPQAPSELAPAVEPSAVNASTESVNPVPHPSEIEAASKPGAVAIAAQEPQAASPPGPEIDPRTSTECYARHDEHEPAPSSTVEETASPAAAFIDGSAALSQVLEAEERVSSSSPSLALDADLDSARERTIDQPEVGGSLPEERRQEHVATDPVLHLSQLGVPTVAVSPTADPTPEAVANSPLLGTTSPSDSPPTNEAADPARLERPSLRVSPSKQSLATNASSYRTAVESRTPSESATPTSGSRTPTSEAPPPEAELQ